MKTKLLTFLAISFLSVLSLSAQLKVGAEAGMNLSHFNSSGSSSGKKVNGAKPGFQIGGTVDYEFGNHWLLMSGLSFMQTKSTMELSYYMRNYFPKTDIKLNHLVFPLRVGYNFRINDKLSLIPSVGMYTSYAFSAGSSSLDITFPSDEGVEVETIKWKPMKGYSYIFQESEGHAWDASIQAFRHWTYGATAGLKAVVCKHYTVAFSYSEDIKKAQKQNGLRNYNYQFSVGYRF